MGLTDDDVREILRIIDESQLDELRIDMPEFRLHVRRGGAPPPVAADQAPAPAPARRRPPGAAAQAPAPAPAGRREPAREGPAPPEPANPSPNGAATIEAPMLGTF